VGLEEFGGGDQRLMNLRGPGHKVDWHDVITLDSVHNLGLGQAERDWSSFFFLPLGTGSVTAVIGQTGPVRFRFR
jgi:hypothetical protein